MMRYAEVPWPWAGLTIALVLLAQEALLRVIGDSPSDADVRIEGERIAAVGAHLPTQRFIACVNDDRSVLTDDGEDLFPNPSQLLNHAPGFYFMWK